MRGRITRRPGPIEPLIQSLAEELSTEFGVEWRRTEDQLKRRRRVRTTRWVTDQPLSSFPGWERRLDATVRRVFDIVDSGMPAGGSDGHQDEVPAEAQQQLVAQRVEGDPGVGLAEGDGPVFLSLIWSVRDRLGGDISVEVGDDRTSLWAVATVKPG